MNKANAGKANATGLGAKSASKGAINPTNDEPIWPKNKGIGMHITGEMMTKHRDKDLLRRVKSYKFD